MPSQRRARLFLLAVFAFVMVLFFYSSHSQLSDGPRDDFYHRTVGALQKGHGGATAGTRTPLPANADPAKNDGPGDNENEDKLSRERAERLRAAEQKAKSLAQQKNPLKPDAPSAVIGVGSSAEGQDKRMAGDGDRHEYGEGEGDGDDEEPAEVHAAKEELNSILKRSPVIIFSKSDCPHSKRAKRILLEKYQIDPPPHVVELDKHPQGPTIQNLLGRQTGRKTVPNVLVNSVSVGGGDELADMDLARELVAKIEYLGSNRVKMKLREGKK